MNRAHSLAALTLTLFLLFAPGCGDVPIGVRRLGGDRVFREITANALTGGTASEFSKEILWRYALGARFRSEPTDVLAALHRHTIRERDRDHVFALSELSFLAGQRTDDKRHFIASVFYAYVYLFAGPVDAERNHYDPRFRLACDLYNRSLAELLRDEDGDAQLKGGTFQMAYGQMTVEVSRPGFPWGPDVFDRFVPATDFLVRGLQQRNRSPGLGVPLIAIQTPSEEPSGARTYVSRELKIPATAFLRISMNPENLAAVDLHASLELYSPTTGKEIEVEGQKVPLEIDLTAPLAYALQESRLWDFEIGGFLASEDETTGLFMIQPYRPGRIPVVFVHGTASSPARWAEMFNGLQAHPELREKFQFWFFKYTTGNPIPYSASLLRDALTKVVQDLDPEGKDAALQRMIVIGHSQGGILTKMQVVDSGDLLWKNISDEKLEDLELSEEVEELVRKAVFFDRVPSVERVVFIATPHRGSFAAAKWYGKLAGSLIALPKNLLNVSSEVIQARDAGHVRKGLGKGMPTSIANMDPASPFLSVLVDIPIPPEVKVHSIIPVKTSGPLTEGNDGIVEYKSAHITGVESEYVVPVGHSCQGYPLTIVEVRRILLEHLGAAAVQMPTPTAEVKS